MNIIWVLFYKTENNENKLVLNYDKVQREVLKNRLFKITQEEMNESQLKDTSQEIEEIPKSFPKRDHCNSNKFAAQHKHKSV